MPNYDIFIEEDGLSHLAKHIKEVYQFDDLFVITDQNVFDLYNEKLIQALIGYKLSFVILPPGEKSKSLDTYHQAIQTLIEKGIKRIINNADELRELGIGGTAIGTGITTHPKFHETIVIKNACHRPNQDCKQFKHIKFRA